MYYERSAYLWQYFKNNSPTSLAAVRRVGAGALRDGPAPGHLLRRLPGGGPHLVRRGHGVARQALGPRPTVRAAGRPARKDVCHYWVNTLSSRLNCARCLYN